jgi:hypothetical protein
METIKIKCQEGDKLRVKRDVNGYLDKNIEVTVIKIASEQKNFLDSNSDIEEPSGLYMQIKANSFNSSYSDGYFKSVEMTTEGLSDPQYLYVSVSEDNPLYNPSFDESPTNTPFIPWVIPEGSQVKFNFLLVGQDSAGDAQSYTYESVFTSSRDYDNMYDFVQGDSIDLTSGTFLTDGVTPTVANYYDDLYDYITLSPTNHILGDDSLENYRFQFLWYNPAETTTGEVAGGKMLLGIRNNNNGAGIPPLIAVKIEVISGKDLFVFETLPTEADPDVFYEDSDVYDIVDGFHMGNIQDQN